MAISRLFDGIGTRDAEAPVVRFKFQTVVATREEPLDLMLSDGGQMPCCDSSRTMVTQRPATDVKKLNVARANTRNQYMSIGMPYLFGTR